MRSLRAVLPLALLACGLAVPTALPAAAADIVYEVVQVPTVGGAQIRVEIQRDRRFDRAKQPVILEYSPYNSLGEPRPAENSRADRYVPKGYAYAVADVLGTRGSSGCWDYGGKNEQQSGADVVRFLSKLPWSNGRVGMTGVSYVGTTANMVAALGDKIAADSNGGRGLAGVIPIAAISHWYGYAYHDGVRYAGNSVEPADEGFDTPLAFDLGFAKTVPADPTSPGYAEAVAARAGECAAAEHTMQGYSRNPDYGAFWKERDYRKDAARFRVPVLMVHGWQDYNVKQAEGTTLYEALPVDKPATKTVEGVPFKKMWMTQEAHADGTGPGYQALVDRFWERTLKRVANGIEGTPAVHSLGRTIAGPQKSFVTSSSWPPAGTKPLTLALKPGELTTGSGTPERTESYVDTGTVTEEASVRSGTSAGGWVLHQSGVLKSDARMAGSAVLDAVVNASTAGQHLTPVLAEVDASGSISLVERGFLNLAYRNGLAKAQPATGWLKARVTFLPQDYTFRKGSRIVLILQSSNTVWAVPGAAGQMTFALGRSEASAVGTRLTLPIVGGARSLAG